MNIFAVIGKFLFTKVARWKLVGKYPGNDMSFVMIVAPHTSNWDVPLGICVKWWINMRIKFYVKSEMFFVPLSWLLYGIGALPLIRSKSTNFVQTVVKDYKKIKNHKILITPEGTRKKVTSFKTGFYFIAKGANVPILPVIFDFTKKEVIISDLIYVTEDKKGDIDKIEDLFSGYIGKIPENSFISIRTLSE